jgi:hypothetical protein
VPARTNQFQKLILFIKKHLAPTVAITESKMLKDRTTGAEREVDVCLEQEVGGHCVTVSVECTDTARKADVTWVEQMKSKHDRLPTNLLVLASARGFTPEARALAKASGIETLELNALSEEKMGELVGRISALWTKCATLEPIVVKIRIAEGDGMLAEEFCAPLDLLTFDTVGTSLGDLKTLVRTVLNSDGIVKPMLLKGEETHQSFQVQWKCPDLNGARLCLKKEQPLALRPIEWMQITGRVKIEKSEFALKHAEVGGVPVSWGTASVMGERTILVLTESAGEKKISIAPQGYAKTSTPGRKH